MVSEQPAVAVNEVNSKAPTVQTMVQAERLIANLTDMV